MKRSTLRFLLLAAALLPMAGCFSLWSDDIDPIYPIDDDAYVVMNPISEPEFPNGWDSPTGHELAMLTSKLLAANVDFHMIDYSNVLELLVAPPSNSAKGPVGDAKIGPDVHNITPRKLADLTGADYVIVCKIIRFQLRDHLDVNMSRATATVDVQLFKVAKNKQEEESENDDSDRAKRIAAARKKLGFGPEGEIAYGGRMVAEARVSASYPNDYIDQYGVSFGDPAELRKGLLAVLAHKISLLFYEHEPPKVPGASE